MKPTLTEINQNFPNMVGGDWNLEHELYYWDLLGLMDCSGLLDFNGFKMILMDFSHILGRIIPTDELIFFKGVGIPPTSPLFCSVCEKSPLFAGFYTPSTWPDKVEKNSKNTRPRTSMEIWCQWNWSSWEVYGIFLQFHWNCDKKCNWSMELPSWSILVCRWFSMVFPWFFDFSWPCFFLVHPAGNKSRDGWEHSKRLACGFTQRSFEAWSFSCCCIDCCGFHNDAVVFLCFLFTCAKKVS